MEVMQSKEVSLVGETITLYSVDGVSWNSNKDFARESKNGRLTKGKIKSFVEQLAILEGLSDD
jgi:hypothetical protein